MKFNLSTRIELFAICTSLEMDIKRYITETVQEIPFTEQMIAKAKERKKDIDCTNAEQVLDQLDLGDYGLLIMSCPCDFGLNNDKVKVFKIYMDKIVPIRNRVMHMKPLELGDRALLLERAYIFIGKFDDAETLLTSVEKKEKHFTMRTQNVLASIWGELYRRRVEKLSQRDYAAKVESYKKALDKFDSMDSLDMKSGLVILYVLNDLSYCLYDKAAIELMISSLEKYSMILGRINHVKKQRLFTHLMKLEENLDEQSFRKIKLILNDKISKYDEVTSPNEGIVTSVKELYGFISNNCYKGSNAVYFSKNNAYSGIQVGDIVRFEVLHTGKGLAARRVEKMIRNNITKT